MQSKLSSFFSSSGPSGSSLYDTASSDSNFSRSVSSNSSINCTNTASSSNSNPLPECPVDPLDPADLIGRTLTWEYKTRLIELGPCQPRLASYPVYEHNDGQKRSFQAKWFDLPCSNKWLEYSCTNNKMYCFACKMFGVQCGEKKEENWVSIGVTGGNWKNSVKRIREHAATQYHMSSMVTFKSSQSIDCLLDRQRAEEQSKRQTEIASNREVLTHLLDIIRLLAKQNLAFRGHNEKASSLNRGNFLEFVHHQAKYDPILKLHLQKAGKNATYLSPDIQNQLINAMANKVCQAILSEVKEAKFFSILVDETPDVSHQEQMTFILRYVDSQCCVCERFIGLLQIAKTNAQSLQQSVNEMLVKHDLQLDDIRGQGYDGAGAMSGQYSGLQSRILAENSMALYVHCHAHILNLVLVDTCTKNTTTRDFFGTVQSLYEFFSASSKRHTVYMEAQKEINVPQPVTLKRLSDTRWACRVDSLRAIKSSLPALIIALDLIIEEEGNGKVVCEARGLLMHIKKFEFILAFEVLLDLLMHTKSLSDYLQQDDLDFVSATDMITSLKEVLQNKRCESSYNEYFLKAEAKCTELEIDELLPPPKRRRVSNRIDDNPGNQFHHQNGKDYYRVEFYFGTLDLLLNGLQNRFSGSSCNILRAFAALHPSKLPADNTSSINILGDFYKSDLDQISLLAEYQVFRRHAEFQTCSSIGDVLKLLYNKNLLSAYPNITCLYRLCLTLPVTTASAERSFSKLKLTKTALRSTMGEARLSSLLLLSIEREITDKVDFNSVIDAFSCLRQRRMLL